MDLEGRKELFRVLVGSHNYNVNTETSDKDYKIFTAPTFDDLYFGNQFKKTIVGETEDFDCHDIRKLSKLFWNSNVSYLEVLFSEEFVINNNLSDITKKLINEIFEHKNEFAKMNLPYLYSSCVGMYITKLRLVDKGTKPTQYLIEKYQYDTKSAMSSLRILDFIRRFANNNFTDFKSAIYYNENDSFRKLLLDFKNGKYSKQEWLDMSNDMYMEVENNYKDIYNSYIPNEELNKYLIELIKEIIKEEIFKRD